MKFLLLKYSIVALSLAAIFISCGATGVDKTAEPTEASAIYNIIRYDRAAEFKLNLIDIPVPDTLAGLSLSFVPLHFWRNISESRDSVDIYLVPPDPNAPADSLPVANVTVIKFIQGTFEIIGVDTANGGHNPIRLSKPFNIVGTITAYFVKLGSDNDTHRGWLLKRVSDASFPGGYNSGITSITIHSASYPNYMVNAGIKDLTSILQFARGESLTIIIATANPYDFVRLKYPGGNGYITREISSDSSLIKTSGFTVLDAAFTEHFVVDVIAGNSVNDTLRYRSQSIGVLFKVR